MTNRKILIVDDDDNICQLITLYLVKEGYGTAICHNGKEAIRAIKDETYDLVLLDVMMPEMDGYETLTEVRKFSDIPIIMVSAKGEPMDKISGLDYGADDYADGYSDGYADTDYDDYSDDGFDDGGSDYDYAYYDDDL